MRLLGFLSIGAGVWLLSGCITTPASQTGWSATTRQAEPIECGGQALVDDLEDGDTQVLRHEGRGGYWYTMLDSHGSTLTPIQFGPDAPGFNGSKLAAHMNGQLTSQRPGVWPYAGLGFKVAEHGSYDASQYQGVGFWAKGSGKIRLEVPDAYTDPGGGGVHGLLQRLRHRDRTDR